MSSFGGRGDYYVDVGSDRVSGVGTNHKFGVNPTIGAGVFEAVWAGGGPYTGFDATAAENVEVFSGSGNDTIAGTGARTLELQGLLAADHTFVTETINLNGITPVILSNQYIRLDRGIVRSAGATGSNEGILTVRQVVTTANVFCSIPIGYNRTMICCYTVPAGRRLFLVGYFAAISKKIAAICTAQLVARPFDEVFTVEEEFSLNSAGTSIFYRRFEIRKGPYAAKTDILVQSDTDTVNASVSAAMDFVLEDVA